MIIATTFFYYDDNGYITRISNVNDDPENRYLEIDNNILEDFFSKPIRDITKYNIKYFQKIINGENVEKETITNKNNSFLILPKVTHYNNEITLEHTKDGWHIHNKNNLNLDLYFYITLKNNINFYLRCLYFNLNNKLVDEFIFEEEKNIDLINIITENKFKSYGIKETK